ncbi:MAG TPA: hypothetical protein PK079_24710 [Leptospiraceae bacterium]|nr:hypothetical protein [Leptospiraceae bacterium]HMW04520.1 hypothetical protein [Leptospiraceae bacterium]HMX31178.1 hypothetical protein [Leptospiraceae bacterium]HMY30706.1 hypothetical protein [Leptospiraceae bacterium]HMZ63225.1 hypothetical protein [Leptospiraceae bacterium]
MRKSSRRKKQTNLNSERELPVEDDVVPTEPDRNIPQIDTTSYIINWDSLNTRRKITAELRDEICDLYYAVQKDPKDQIEKLKQMLEEYSDIQIFYNYLENAYRAEEEFEKANEIARITAKKFPDFLFGKISQIELYLEEKELDKVAELLQDKYDFRLLYPEKATFHIQEILCFNYALGKYFALRTNPEKATAYLENIKGIDEDHVFVKQLQKFINKNSGLKFYQKVLNKLK